jgi:hypothetical protein
VPDAQKARSRREPSAWMEEIRRRSDQRSGPPNGTKNYTGTMSRMKRPKARREERLEYRSPNPAL